MNKLKEQAIARAGHLLSLRRQADFVKRITGVTIIEMVRQGWLFEVRIPGPDGQVVRTGQYRSVFGQPTPKGGKSNKQMKREDRRAFFRSRRVAAQRQLRAAG